MLESKLEPPKTETPPTESTDLGEKEKKDLVSFLQEIGAIPGAKQLQLLQKIYDPDIKESLTVLPTKRQVAHLNYMKGLVDLFGKDTEIGKFIDGLRIWEIHHWRSIKGIGLEKVTNAVERQNASEITVKSETIPQMIAEKPSFMQRLTGRGKPE